MLLAIFTFLGPGEEEPVDCQGVRIQKCSSGLAARSRNWPCYMHSYVSHVAQSDFGTRLAVSSMQGGCPMPPPTWRRALCAPVTGSSSEQKLETRSVESCYRGHPVHIMLSSAQFLFSSGREVKSR